MHHIYTGGKGDPLCPLGFHPQVRWPTRCKRCFRDYKEHGGKSKEQGSSMTKEDMTRSTPSLSSWTSRSKDDGRAVSTAHMNSLPNSNDSAFLNGNKASEANSNFSLNKSLSSSSSWTSTPDLGAGYEDVSTTVSVTLPRRRPTSKTTESSSTPTEYTVRRRSYTADLSQVNISNGSFTNGKANSVEPSERKTNSTSGQHQSKKPSGDGKKGTVKLTAKPRIPEEKDNTNEGHINPDVEFILRVKSSGRPEVSKKPPTLIRQSSSVLVPTRTSSSSSSSGPEDSVEEEEEDDAASTTNTETTETTLVGKNDSELLEEVESLRNELEVMKARCEKVEREKSDILLRRLASLDTSSTKTAASEVLKLQQKLNELSSQSEDLKDDNKSLSLKVKELEKELDDQKVSSNSNRLVEELQGKLAAAETLCEELMDENEEMKKELRELEEEIEEMQDNFREDQADEYSSLKKELEQTTKNCRILSFKLRKSERKAEQLESEKLEAEHKYKEVLDQKGVNSLDRIKTLEGDLKVANEMAARLTKDLEEANKRLKTFEKKNEPSASGQKFGNTLKPGGSEKVSRASLTRGGSQEDPQQLLRDLQDSMEREADLREQLRFAEEEAANLRKKAARVEEDNDSLALQLKKMATKAKTSRRSSPSTNNRTPRPVTGKDEETSDEEDPAELRLLLELNEQESAVLRKKVEDLETESEKSKKKIKELEDKLAASPKPKKPSGIAGTNLSPGASLLDKEKIKVAEEEVAELRKKLIEKDHEIKRLEDEIQLSTKKGSRGHLIKSQSLDSPNEQKSLDLKRQLEMVEQEATILRTKITTLESDNEKLSSENKKLQLLRGAKKVASGSESGAKDKINTLETKILNYEKEIKELKEKLESKPSLPVKESADVEKLKKDIKIKGDELEKVKTDNKKMEETLKRLRDDAAVDVIEFYKSRKPKKPTDLTTKLQLKKMVEDLENEIAMKNEVMMKSSRLDEVKSFAGDLRRLGCDIFVLLKRFHSQKKDEEASEDLEAKANRIAELEEELNRVRLQQAEKSKEMEENLSKHEKELEAWAAEKKKLDAEISKFKAEKKSTMVTQDDLKALAKKLETSNKELDEERLKVKHLKEKMEDLEKVEETRKELEKELSKKSANVRDAEAKLTEVEEKLKKAEKNLSVNRSKVAKLEKTVEELERAKKDKERKCQTLDDELSTEKTKNSSLMGKVSDLEAEIKKSKDAVKYLEETIRKERERITDEHLKADSIEKKEITALREDLSKKSKLLDEVNEKLERAEKAKKSMEENHKKVEAEILKDKSLWEKKATDFEAELNSERKKAERAKIARDKEENNRESEMNKLRAKMTDLEKTAGLSNKEMSGIKEEWTSKCKKLEKNLADEKKKYEDLTTKYEILEEEHVVTKAQLVLEKEQAQTQLNMNKKEVATLEVELKRLQDTYVGKQEAWAKEKKDLQEKLKGNLEKAAKDSEAKWELEKSKLRAVSDEQKSLIEQLKQQNDSMVEQMNHMRKENEELRKKFEDFDKVSKIQRQMTADTQVLEKQLREAREKLSAEDKNHKSELAALKLRYESRVNLISGELQTSQNHVSRFKRERDTFKHMLEEAKTQMAELKKGNVSEVSDELKDGKTSMAALEQQVSCLEDELSEARLECSKLRTELISEKSAREVKMSELQSKVNELEEEKILSSGRTKVVGLRTKMELAWQKEREDQQRLLQETSALARDLRQTLYEVERERDKIKLESKRIQEQIKRAAEEEMEENRRKITELQCDLLELRDAHAKLRTTNEKLRREKEKWDKENRTVQKSRIRTEEEERNVHHLLDNIDLLLKANFEKKSSKKFIDSSKRSGSKSRESSPLTTTQDDFQLILQRLSETAEDVRMKMQMNDRGDDRSKRASSVGYRSLRATSTESDTSEMSAVPRRPVQASRKATLHRKSLSLSETANPNAQDQAIWREIDNGGSLTSLEEQSSSRLKNSGYRENSMDSRLSGGSTQSEMIPGDKKKKKGLFGKLKKLTKSRSIDDAIISSQEDIIGRGSDSDVSGTGDFRDSKRDLKGKFVDMFKKESSRHNKGRHLKGPDEGKSSPLPPHGKGASPVNSAVGRPLDRARNPAASHLNKP